MSNGRRTAVVAALVAATVAWLTVGAIYVIVLVSRQIGGDILFCGDRPRGSSQYGDASWQWWYPGTRCTYAPTGTSPGLVEEPSAASGVLAFGLVVWPALIVGAAARLVREDSDFAAPDTASGLGSQPAAAGAQPR